MACLTDKLYLIRNSILYFRALLKMLQLHFFHHSGEKKLIYARLWGKYKKKTPLKTENNVVERRFDTPVLSFYIVFDTLWV